MPKIEKTVLGGLIFGELMNNVRVSARTENNVRIDYVVNGVTFNNPIFNKDVLLLGQYDVMDCVTLPKGAETGFVKEDGTKWKAPEEMILAGTAIYRGVEDAPK